MAGLLSYGIGTPQVTDEYYRNLPSNAMMQGTMQEEDDAMKRQYAQIAASLPMYDTTAIDFGRRMVAAKTAYDQAASDQERAMAHEMAEGVRQYAAKNGIDLSPFDANTVNTNQARNNLSMITEEARRNFMNQETPDEFYSRRRNELMRGGLGERRAQEQAAREMQEYRAGYLHAGKKLFYDQGTTDNAINNLGAYLATELDPQSAGVFAQLYAHPVDNYNMDAWTQKALTTADLADRQSVLRNQLGIEAANNAFNNQRVLNADEFERLLQKMGLQHRFNQEDAAIAGQAQVQNLVNMMNLYKMYHPEATDAEAWNYVVGGSGKSDGNISEKYRQASDDYVKKEKNLEDLLKLGENADKYEVTKAFYELQASAEALSSASKGDNAVTKDLENRMKKYDEIYSEIFGESLNDNKSTISVPPIKLN